MIATMIGEVGRNLLSSTELWAGIIGAVVGSLSAGFITALLQIRVDTRERELRKEEKADATKARLLSLAYSLTRATSDLSKLWESIDESRELRKTLSSDIPMWTSIKSLAWLPLGITISPDELTALVDLGEVDLINDVSNVAMTHNSAVNVWKSYGELRFQIGDIFETRETGTGMQMSALSAEARAKHLPKLIVLEDLANAIDRDAKADYDYAKKALDRHIAVLKKHFSLNFTVVHKPGPQA